MNIRWEDNADYGLEDMSQPPDEREIADRYEHENEIAEERAFRRMRG